MLLTFVLFGFVNSSCLTRNFEECLSLNVEYQDNCQLSKGECLPRPSKCTEIDATYPLNCKTSECYYSKRFNKCLSQPFTRLLNEVASRRGQQHHQGGSAQGNHQGGPTQDNHQSRPQNGPTPPQQPPQQPPQYPPTETNQTQPSQNNEQNIQISSSQTDNSNESDDEESSKNSEEYDDSEEQDDSDDDDQYDNEPQTQPEAPQQNNLTNTTKSSGFSDTYNNLQQLIQQEIQTKLNESDEEKQIEIKTSGIKQLIMALASAIILI